MLFSFSNSYILLERQDLWVVVILSISLIGIARKTRHLDVQALSQV